MTKVNLPQVGNIIDVTTAATTINNNFATLQTAIDNTLSRDGTQPNTMGANIDMDSHRILNLPAPGDMSEPARLQDLQEATLGTQAVLVYNAPQTLTNEEKAQVQTNIGIDTSYSTSAGYTIKGNSTSTSAATADISIPALIQKASPIANDKIMIADSAASNALKYATVGSISVAGSVSSLNGLTGAVSFFFPPQGRLTLTTAVPVMTSSVASAATIYYTPYQGDMLPIYDGTYMVPTTFSELSQSTTDTTKNPAAIGVSKVNDWFVWNDGGTIRLSHGPDWTSDTARSAGTALVLVNGIYLNNASITNGPAASRGTYVGTTRSDGSSRLNWIVGGFASGGTAGNLAVWNSYNRVPVTAVIGDTTTSWTYGVAGTWRAANNSATMRCSMVRGLDVDQVYAEYCAVVAPGSATSPTAGIGLDSTTVFSGTSGFATTAASTNVQISGKYSGIAGLGYHYVSALEYNSTATASNWYGAPAAYVQTGLHVVTFQ